MEKDHTTAIHAFKKISNDLATKPPFKDFTEKLFLSLRAVEDPTNPLDVGLITPDEIRFLNKKILSEAKESAKLLAPTKITPESTVEFETSEDILNSNKSLEISDREIDILSKYRRGMTLEEIAETIHVTRERVRQIVQSTLIKELGQRAREGFKIDVKEYINSQKDLHRRSQRLPDEKRREIIQKIESGMTLKEIMKEYRFENEKFIELFPQYEDKLAMELTQKKRWSRSYDRCRSCRTTAVPHEALGYCEDCYHKSAEFKEMQKKSHEKYSEGRKDKVKAYMKEYTKRPEVIAKMKSRASLATHGGNREKALERDSYRCSNCEITSQGAIQRYGRDLYVWHKDGNLKNNSLDNLETLCANCFLKASNRGRIRKRLGGG
jgi:5-methylcytosine-specific restriction endonuclease McrA/DNA-directed RNA polymerase specialized sigma24 family protein